MSRLIINGILKLENSNTFPISLHGTFHEDTSLELLLQHPPFYYSNR